MYRSSQPYPYLPADRTIEYVPDGNPFMARARELCETHTRFCGRLPTAAVIVKNGQIIGEGRNGGENPPAVCKRVELGIPSGQRYDLCPGCDTKNHAEPSAIRNATAPTADADLYLYGHWWCCEPCWQAMIAAGVRAVFLVEGATERFSTLVVSR